MIISVASGKGGTGKTTFATNLAMSLSSVQFFDCDVEEPNANIFLHAKIKKKKNVEVQTPKIDKRKCNFCGKCADFCRFNALAVVPSEVLVFPELCHSCGGCELVCPENAVKWKKRVIGKVESGVSTFSFNHSSGQVDLYQGFLNIGEAMAIPVIKAVKKHIDESRDVIIDAPPGTSCPVIETVKDSDYCVLVTEPTPFGLHDLKLAIDVIRHLYIPFGVVINRDGVGDDAVERFCAKEDIPVLMKIPHSKEIAELYSQGEPFVKEDGEYQKKFYELFERIKNGDES